jgi:predicted outer membrane repeat protein
MTPRSRIRNLFARSPRTGPKSTSRQRRTARLGLEYLEDRLAPANFTLNSLGDIGTGSGTTGDMRYCITQANLVSGASTITIPPSLDTGSRYQIVNGTLQLVPGNVIKLNGSQLPTITGQLTIQSALTTFAVSGEGESRVFQVGNTGNLTLNNLEVENGLTTGDGGGILATGPLTLNHVTVENNTASIGGGIFTQSNLTLDHDTVQNNTAAHGGGIGSYSQLASVTISSSTIRNNTAQGASGGNGVGPPAAACSC